MGCMSADTILELTRYPGFNSLLFHTLQLFGIRRGEVKIIMKLTAFIPQQPLGYGTLLLE
jgi:hypothetical protein